VQTSRPRGTNFWRKFQLLTVWGAVFPHYCHDKREKNWHGGADPSRANFTFIWATRCPCWAKKHIFGPLSKNNKGKSKEAYSSSWNSPQNYGTPLVNRITQCYLPPDRGDRPACTPNGQVGTRFIGPVRMKGWVFLVGWLRTEMVYPSTDGHPSWY